MGPFKGGQAEYLRVPYADFNCLKLPGTPGDEWEDDFVLLADIWPTGYHGVELSGFQVGESIAIWGGGADGLETDAAGNIYCTNYEHHAITRRGPDGQFETVAHDPRLRWPDTMSVGHDGYLYVTANGFHEQARFHQGRDERHKPYYLYRLRIDAQPVLLR